MMRPATALTIAGSDPSGGAGIQADLKTFAAIGAYGCAVLTALTAQSTRGVAQVHVPPASFLAQQLDTLFEDIQIDAIKIGMVADADIAHTLAGRLQQWRADNPDRVIVLDPVMISTSGHPLLEPDAVQALRDQVLPLADLVTPNLHEAALLSQSEVARDAETMAEQAQAIAELGVPAVLVKGGHLLLPESMESEQAVLKLDLRRTVRSSAPAQAIDVLYGPSAPSGGEVPQPGLSTVRQLSHPVVQTANTHGTGCTLSSSIAGYAGLQLHAGVPVDDWAPVITKAQEYLTGALRSGAQWRLGAGSGPVDHAWGLR